MTNAALTADLVAELTALIADAYPDLMIEIADETHLRVTCLEDGEEWTCTVSEFKADYIDTL